MQNVQGTIKIMRESNYFFAWDEVLLGDNILDEWERLLSVTQKNEKCTQFAIKFYEANIPFVIVSEYVDEFFRYYLEDSSRHEIKNKIAQAYLKKKLSEDKVLLENELRKKISFSIESKQELINAHMKWVKCFICDIIGEPSFFELDYTKCDVGTWLLEEGDNVSSLLFNKHKNLHSMAHSAMRMYNRHDYAYFLLLYTDILSSSYQIRDSIMNIYFSRRVVSVFEDPVSSRGNYFKLKLDIQKQKSKNSIMMFNIKEFSKINLLYGHDVGDKLIKEVTDIVASIKQVISVYRIYGDEFAALFLTQDKQNTIKDIKNRLHSHEFLVPENTIALSFYGSVADISTHVLEHCEYGLMISKQHYGEIVDVNEIDEQVFKTYANEITLSQQLRLAFLDNRDLIYFQPIMDMKSKKITKYEVLMRVRDHNSNILVPKDYLDVLKEMYIYPEVTKLIIKNSFEVFKDSKYEFSINLSFTDIINSDTRAFILAIIKKYPDVASRSTFELLENEAMLNELEVNHFLEELHLHNVKIALDDFGVGYANYDTIFKFNIDYIKIDGSLTETMLTSPKSKILIESIATVAEKLDAKLIVEFVSSKEIFDAIDEMYTTPICQDNFFKNLIP